jgi:hypothetical protein
VIHGIGNSRAVDDAAVDAAIGREIGATGHPAPRERDDEDAMKTVRVRDQMSVLPS